MTLLAAIARGSDVYMIADTHGYGEGRVYPAIQKIVRRKVVYDDHTQAGDVLIASAGTAAMVHIARQAPIPNPKRTTTGLEFADDLSIALQRYSSELAIPQTNEDQQWLCGWQGFIWTCVSYDIMPQNESGFETVGAGADTCLGALEILARNDLIWANPERALQDAGDATAKWCYYVKPPWQVEHLTA